MSTILKALRRLEQERARGGERPLREEVVLARPRRRGPWGVWAATGAALAAGFAATWLVLGSFGGTPPPAAVPAPAPRGGLTIPAPATPSDIAAPAPSTPIDVEAAPPAAPAAPAAALSSPRFVPGREPLRPAASLHPVASPPAVAAPPPRVAAEPPAPALPPAAVEEPILTAPIVGRAPRFVDDDEVASAAPAVPVDVVRTSWHPMADRRSAWVAIAGESPREVREGEWVGAYEVRSIEPDGVLFADGPLLVHRPVGE